MRRGEQPGSTVRASSHHGPLKVTAELVPRTGHTHNVHNPRRAPRTTHGTACTTHGTPCTTHSRNGLKKARQKGGRACPERAARRLTLPAKGRSGVWGPQCASPRPGELALGNSGPLPGRTGVHTPGHTPPRGGAQGPWNLFYRSGTQPA